MSSHTVKGGDVTPETRALLEEMKNKSERGFILESDRLMMEADPEWQKAWRVFGDETYAKQRRLDRKTVELIQIVANTCGGAGVPTIENHIRMALELGCTPGEIMEACENVVMITGSNVFHTFQVAYGNVIGPKMEVGKYLEDF